MRQQIRYHSAYPWHDKGEYARFMAPGDAELLQAVKEFNKVRPLPPLFSLFVIDTTRRTVRLVSLMNPPPPFWVINQTTKRRSLTCTPRMRRTTWTSRRSGRTTRASSTSTCPPGRSAGKGVDASWALFFQVLYRVKNDETNPVMGKLNRASVPACVDGRGELDEQQRVSRTTPQFVSGGGRAHAGEKDNK